MNGSLCVHHLVPQCLRDCAHTFLLQLFKRRTDQAELKQDLTVITVPADVAVTEDFIGAIPIKAFPASYLPAVQPPPTLPLFDLGKRSVFPKLNPTLSLPLAVVLPPPVAPTTLSKSTAATTKVSVCEESKKHMLPMLVDYRTLLIPARPADSQTNQELLEISGFLTKKELLYVVNPTYLLHQAEMKPRMRAVLVDWLIEVGAVYVYVIAKWPDTLSHIIYPLNYKLQASIFFTTP